MEKKRLIDLSARATNVIIGLFGAVLILTAIIVGTEKTCAVILLSVGTSVFASALVSGINSKYLIKERDTMQLMEIWSIENIYKARSEINVETNALFLKTKHLDICAMGLKEFRDAQSKTK